MTEIIFTYRPLEFKKPISWINSITRFISKRRNSSVYEPDHISIKKGPWIYESSAGVGVHKIKYSDWVVGREGTRVQVYEAPDSDVIIEYFELLEGKPYDYRSAVLHAFAAHKAMKRRAMKAFTCSEFAAYLMGEEEYYMMLPSDIKLICEERGYPLDEIELA